VDASCQAAYTSHSSIYVFMIPDNCQSSSLGSHPLPGWILMYPHNIVHLPTPLRFLGAILHGRQTRPSLIVTVTAGSDDTVTCRRVNGRNQCTVGVCSGDLVVLHEVASSPTTGSPPYGATRYCRDILSIFVSSRAWGKTLRCICASRYLPT
jgi:hypothetical protein